MEIEVDWRHFNQVTWCHARIRYRFRIKFRSGKPNSNWNELSSLIARCIWWKLQAHATGHSDHSDRVSIHRLPNKKAYAEGVYCSPTVILLAEIVNQFITSAILAAMISSVEMHGKTG